LSRIAVVLAGTLLTAPGCYGLSKVDPGPRWIDDFSAPTPSWSVFAPWACGTYLVQAPNAPDGGLADGGMDGAMDGGRADAATADAGLAPFFPCPPGPGDVNIVDASSTRGLAFSFDLPSGLGAVAETTIAPPIGPVDFTGFQQFIFSAKLQSASTQTPLPSGTVLIVELGCLRNGNDNIASQVVPDTMLTRDSTAWAEVHLPLSMFFTRQTSLSQTCRSEVDSIRFKVPPGRTDVPTVAGTLALDNISLQN
jgi:hypothetical protein